MKTIAIIAALASVAFGQLNDIPQCAVSCFLDVLQNDGCSSLTDFKCHCEKGATLIGSVKPCVDSSCSPSDQEKTIAGVSKVCAGVGVPLPEIPSGTPAPSEQPSATPAPSEQPSQQPSEQPSAYPTGTPSAPPSYSTPVGTGTLPTGNGTAPTYTPPPFTGAAPQVTQVGAVLAGLAAAAMVL